MFLRATVLICVFILCIVPFFIHRFVLSDVNEKKELDRDANATIQRKVIIDSSDKVISYAPEDNKADNGLLRDARSSRGFNYPLHLAVSDRDIHQVIEHLNYGEDVNVRGDNGVTPLMLAAATGDLDIVNLLISRNASLEIKDEFDNAAIHHAVMRGNLNVVMALLTHGADANGKGDSGLTPLMIAIMEGDIDTVNLLIARNATLEIKDEMNNAALHLAARKGDVAILKSLLNYATNSEDDKSLIMPPLIFAVWKIVEDGVNLSISKNISATFQKYRKDAGIHVAEMREPDGRVAFINSRGENGNTPLIFTLVSKPKYDQLRFSQNSNREKTSYENTSIESTEEKQMLATVKTLVEYGADVNIQNHIGRTALHEAVIRGLADVVHVLLSNKASLNYEDNFCYTPLHWAANNSKIDLINILLEYGDDINRKGCNNVTAVHLAIERNDSKLMEFLLSKNADPNTVREDERTPLDVAFQRSFIPFIKLLLDNGAKVEDGSFLGSKVLFGAVANKSSQLLRLLLAKTVNLGSYPTVILNYAIGTKFFEGTKLLVLSGANIELKDVHGNIPLSSAVLSRSTSMVKLILDVGARTIAKENIKTFLGANSNVKVVSALSNVTEIHRLSPLHIAAFHGLKDITELLISYGASLEVRDERKYTPLHYACENGHVATVRILLDSGANKSSTDIHGRAPIHLACKQGQLLIVQLLLSGAPVDVNTAENNGYTPLHFAAMNGSSEIVKLLLSLNADIDAKSNNLTAPLHLASLEGNKKVVKILLEAGAEREASDADDMTPMHYAARERYSEIVDLLLGASGFTFSNNKNGSTALHLTCGSYNTRRKQSPFSKQRLLNIIQAFKNNMIFANDPDNNKMTVLHIAARDGSSTCAEEFLPTDSLHGDISKNTPLHYAALNGHIEIVKMILKVKPTARREINYKHETPLMFASREGHTGVVQLLLQGLVDDFRPDIDGRTPLHRSACRGHFTIVKLLLSSMAKRDAEDKWGFTPLNYAASWKGHQDVIGFLSTSPLDITLSYYYNVSNPFQRKSAKITNFFI